MQNKDALLEVRNLTKTFSTDREILYAVNDISFTLHRGECLGVVGESGCGKSTLAKMIVGILKPTQGSILLDDVEYTCLSKKEQKSFQRNIQMVFQDPYSSFSPRMKIGAYLTESRRNFDRIRKEQAKKEAKELLHLVGLPEEFVQRYPHQLSGGQLQRAAIARAIAIHPRLLVCDEATGALDVSIQNQIAQLIVKLVEEKKIGCLFIGHDLALVRSVSQRIVVMYLGYVVEILESETLLEDAAHPYTKALLSSVFSIYCSQTDEIHLLKGEPPSPLILHEGCAFSSRCERCTEMCRKKKPELINDYGRHFIACFYPVEKHD